MTAPWYTDPANLARLVRFYAADGEPLDHDEVVYLLEKPWKHADGWARMTTPCPECKAPAGEPCRDLDTGRRFTTCHSIRVEDATEEDR